MNMLKWFVSRRRSAQPMQISTLLLLLVTVCVLLLIINGGKLSSSRSAPCDQGPLEIIDSCTRDASPPQWGYSFARGRLSKTMCNHMSLSEETIGLPSRQRQPELIRKMDCSLFELSNNTYFCYASQHEDENKQQRILNVVIAEGTCGTTFYFRGENATFNNGEPRPLKDWKHPVAGIPE